MSGTKTGGRQKGTPNKRSTKAMKLAEELGVDPLKVILLFVKGDWEALGLDEFEMKVTKDGSFPVRTITADMRLNAARDAAKYIYPQLKALELSVDSDEDDPQQITGIRIDLEERKRAIKGEK